MQYKPGVNIVPFLPTPGKLRTTTKTLESYYAGPQLDTIQIEELRTMGKKLQDWDDRRTSAYDWTHFD